MVNSFYFPDQVGGAERSLKILADALTADGHEVAVLATGEPAAETERVGQVRVFRRPSANIARRLPASLPSGLRKAAFHLHNTYTAGSLRHADEALDAFRPDVVHTNNLAWLSVSVWGAASRRRIPIVHTLRDYALLCANYGFFRGGQPCGTDRCFQCKLLSANKIAATRQVTAVVGNSRYTLDRHLEEGAFPQARHSVIYNGYRTDQPIDARRHPRRDGRPFVVGFIGTLTAHKGVEMLLKTFAGLVRGPWQGHAVELVIAGEGEPSYTAHLRALAEGLPVKFLGVVPQPEFFKQVDVCVVPSLWAEPLSRVLFEAFAHGVPVIASATGGSGELVKPGETGWLFDIHAADGLAVQLQAAYDDADRYEAISRTALALAATFRPERVVSEYIDLYETVQHRG
ncbi:hypothetical protein ASC91_21835 [Pelomonas sp. Root1237]|nr:hypothetical protein ASC91_21835 [Pelomonas sp. Root1237]